MRLALFAALVMSTACGQVVITDSGSTNRPGMTVTLNDSGQATIEGRAGAKVQMTVQSDLKDRFRKDLEAAAPLDQMKVRHCAKSASFGSSMFVTYKGVRSSDMSCSGQTDPLVAALQKDMQEILSQAQALMPSNKIHLE